jgi:hypothetical protein
MGRDNVPINRLFRQPANSGVAILTPPDEGLPNGCSCVRRHESSSFPSGNFSFAVESFFGQKTETNYQSRVWAKNKCLTAFELPVEGMSLANVLNVS